MSDSQHPLAQDTLAPIQICATLEHHRHLLATDPGYKSRRQSVEQFNLALRQVGTSLRAGPSWIPVVVHVVYNTVEQNISNEQIKSQIDVLNADFTAENADMSEVPAVFKPLIGDPRVRFFLTARDPQGNPTTGITRTKTTETAFPRDPISGRPIQKMKFTAQGGIDAWPSDRYLNIWVCYFGDGLLGFAQFPGGPEATDGVVIQHSCFGTTGTVMTPHNLGRVSTHEVGHWLNCYHIWGDDVTMCSGTDHCEDTPNQAGSNRGVPTFPTISCKNGPNGDLFMNYMDYTNDVAKYMFTKGQVARMDATLSGPRASIAGSNFQEFILQTGTALHETDNTFKFLVGHWKNDSQPDLVAIKMSGTGTASTEIHILSGASNFQTYSVQTGTALHETSEAECEFAMGDWNGDGNLDLFIIKKNNTGTQSTEVHILSGASNFQEFLLHTGTALHNTDDTFDFALADWNGDGKPDLFAIKKSNTGTNTTEVHVLSGASNFQQFILQTGTALHQTDQTFDFAVVDWNGDGKPDLVAIEKSNSGTSSTDVHVLAGALGFQEFILHTGTALHSTDGKFEFAMVDWNHKGRPDLVAIKKRTTGTNSTELHVLGG